MRQARQLNYPLVKLSTGSLFAQKAARTCGLYKSHFFRKAMTFRDDRGLPWLKHDLCPPHTGIEILFVDLRPKPKPADKKDAECELYGLEKYKPSFIK